MPLRKDLAQRLFAHDVEDLKGVAGSLRIRGVELPAPGVATWTLRWKGRTLRVVARADPRYFIEPTSLKFCNPDNIEDTAAGWWPDGVNGINQGNFVCTPGFREGHSQHGEWAYVSRKNRVGHLAQRLQDILKAEDWPAEAA